MSRPLDGSWSLVLGASAGIGLGCAEALAAAGSHIIGVHLDVGVRRDAVPAAVERLRAHGVEAHFFNENAASDRARARMMPAITELAGADGIRVFLHSLSFGSLAPYIGPTSPETGHASQAKMDMTLSVMAHSLVYWSQDLVGAELLRAGAKVFAMTSVGSSRVVRSYGMVSAAKAALESHVRQLAVELAPCGVSVNALRAGVTLTESFRRIPESATLHERAAAVNPHGRLTTPQDVAETVVLLAQARTSWLTGNVIGVDGGEILAG